MSYQATSAVFDHVPATMASGSDRLVLLALANHASGDTMECWPSIALIAKEAGVTEDTVKRSLRVLVERGLIEREVNGAPDARIPRDRRPNLYRLHLTGGTDTGGRDAGSRDTGGRETTQRGGESRVDGGDNHASTGGRIAPPKQSLNLHGTVSEPSLARPAAERVSSDEFEQWWALYPKKVNKKAARAKYVTVRKSGVTADALTEGLRAWIVEWRDNRTDPQYIPGPDRWLNAGKWEDDVGSTRRLQLPEDQVDRRSSWEIDREVTEAADRELDEFNARMRAKAGVR
jgi:hypothetical protein